MQFIQRSILSLICLIFLFVFYIEAQEKQSRDLFVIQVGKKKGFIDKTGKVVIEPRFDQVDVFSGGIARVWINCDPCEKRFIDDQGAYIRNPILDEGPQLEFSEGLAAVHIGSIVEGRRGFIDNRGNIIIQPKYKSTFRFSEGLAQVMAENNLHGYIDRTEKMIIEPQFEDADDFHEGLAQIKVNGKIGFIDKTGKIIISPKFEQAWDFSEGLAPVQVGGLWGFIDKTGKIAIKAQYKEASEFSEELARVRKNKKYGFIDKSGHLQINFKFDEASAFSEAVAVVKINYKYQFIDKSGNFVFTQRFDSAEKFNGGLAEVSIGQPTYANKRGYIDKTGKFVWVNK